MICVLSVIFLILVEALIQAQLLEALAQLFGGRVDTLASHCRLKHLFSNFLSLALLPSKLASSSRLLHVLRGLVEGDALIMQYDGRLFHRLPDNGGFGMRQDYVGSLESEFRKGIWFLTQELSSKPSKESCAFSANIIGGDGVLGGNACVGILECKEQVASRQDTTLSAFLHYGLLK